MVIHIQWIRMDIWVRKRQIFCFVLFCLCVDKSSFRPVHYFFSCCIIVTFSKYKEWWTYRVFANKHISHPFFFLHFVLAFLSKQTGQSAVNAVTASHNVRLNSAGSVSSLTSGCNNAMFQQQISNSSNVSIAEEALSIGDVADLLHPQYAIITGGRSREGCPIITFPDHNNFHLLTEHDYEKLISYLTSVPTWVKIWRVSSITNQSNLVHLVFFFSCF